MKNTALTAFGGFVIATLIGCVYRVAQPPSPQASGKAIWDEYADLVKGAQTVSALGPNLFGDEVSLQQGALSFSVVDVSVRGNNALPVAITRTFATRAASSVFGRESAQYNKLDGAMSDWEIDLPFVGGVFARSTGWVEGSQTSQRCSITNPAWARPPTIGYIHGSDYFGGIQINVPGHGKKSMLVRKTATPQPSGGGTYWITSDWTSVSCLPAIKNGDGEGFLATTSDGTRYWFDWMATASEQTFKKPNPLYGFDELARGRYGLYATRVEDRHGNWVEYTYGNAANMPVRVSRIDSVDGRAISVDHNTSGLVRTVTAHGRIWTYGYSNGTNGRLTSVTLPDGSRWSINLPGFQNLAMRYAVYAAGEPYRGCGWPGDWLLPLPVIGTVQHPSGAIGEFTLTLERFRRDGIDAKRNCPGSVDHTPNDDTEYYPTVWDRYSLTNKRVTGPGLVPSSWTYVYGGGYRTEVTGPGDFTRYVFGNTFRQNEGKLLQVERGINAQQLLSKQDFGYAQLGAIGDTTQPRRDDFGEEQLLPEKTRVILQEGVSFSRTSNSFDAFARPVNATKSSTLGYSKTDGIEYHDNLSNWVLGQSKRHYDAVTGLTMAQTIYDTEDLPWKTASFGKVTQTITYNPDGTVSTVSDGKGNTTTLSNWMRGIPQSILHADGNTRSAVVNEHGLVTKVIDENGYETTYDYDGMGRLEGIYYPTDDSVVWNRTTLTFASVPSPEYGLPAGHWKQIVNTGNARKATYFDAMWRPVVVEQYDTADVAGTRSLTVTRYDGDSRRVYQSYPLASLSDYAAATQGIRTYYDALNRVTRVEQDSELGVLVTATDHLTGFKRRITNPRNFATTEEFQAYDEPSYDLPVRMRSPEGVSTVITRDVFGKPRQVTRTGQGG